MAEAVLPKAQIDALFQSLRTLDQQRDIRDVLALTIAPKHAIGHVSRRGEGLSPHAGDHSRAASAAGPVKRCMHPCRPRAQRCHQRQPRERRQGPRRHLTRRTCRIAPTTSRCDTAF